MSKKRLTLLGIGAVILGTVGVLGVTTNWGGLLGGRDGNETNTPSPTPVASYTYPLTGLKSAQQVKTRPIIVMVENSQAARPQSGLNKADIVYEILAEGEITRFVAVFQSGSSNKIGPVRSTRPYFAQIAKDWQAALFHCGGSKDGLNFIKANNVRDVDQIYGGYKYFWRASDRFAPHNLYTSSARLKTALKDKSWDDAWTGTGLNFGADVQTTSGETANSVRINYIYGYYVDYKWDEANQRYNRYMVGSLHKDRESGEQLYANNIIIAKAAHQILDQKGRRSVDVLGPGSGYLLQGGKILAVTWKSVDGHMRVYDGDKELTMLPGKTWIQVMPTGNKVSWQ